MRVTGPLADITVLEIGAGAGARYAGRLFAQMGARVTRLEIPEDPTLNPDFRAWLDEGKSVLAGDLTTGLAALDTGPVRPLVIVEARPDAIRALDEALEKAGFSGVRVGLTWFGMTGPYADLDADDALVHAMSGMAQGFGPMEGPPNIPRGATPRQLAAVNAFIGGLAALMAGENAPSAVDVNALEGLLCLTEPAASSGAADPTIVMPRMGVNVWAPIYPAAAYATTDGWLGVTCVTPTQWESLCALLDRPDLAEAPYLATAAERTLCSAIVDEELAPLIKQHPTAYWVAEGDRRRIPMCEITRPGDLPAHPHWSGRGAFAEVDSLGVQGPTLPFRFSADGVTAPRPNGPGLTPLKGVRVADFTMGWAGPLGARYLADLGADVLKIESVSHPDWWRGWERVELQDPPLHELPRPFMNANRNKRGLDIDLGTAEGLALARGIIGQSDLVIENQGPGVMAKLGLDAKAQRALRPGVISVSMPPFGAEGPLSNLRAYGSTVEHASGLPHLNGEAEWPPANQHVAYGDPITGMYGAAASMAALWARPRVGGSTVEVCQVECLFQLAAEGILADQRNAYRREGSRRPDAAPCMVAPTDEDDLWVAVIAPDDAAWRALCALTAAPPGWEAWRLGERKAHETDIEAHIADWTGDHSADGVVEQLRAIGLRAGRVAQPAHLHFDPHLVANDYWVRLNRRYIGEHVVPQSPILFDNRRPAIHRPAPWVGESTAEVLRELGLE